MLTNLSIRAKLVAGFLLIAFCPLVVLGLLLFQQGKKDILRATEENLFLSINITRKQVDSFIQHGLEHILLLSNLPQVARYAESMTGGGDIETGRKGMNEVFLSSLHPDADIGEYFYLHPETGEVLSSGNPDHIGKFFDKKEYFIHGREGPYIYRVHYSLPLERNILALAVPVVREGRLLGVIACWVNLDRLVDTVNMNPRSTNYLVSRSNLHIYGSREDGGLPVTSGVFTDGVMRALEGETGSGVYADSAGTPVVGAYTLLGGLDLALVSEVPLATVLGNVNRLARTILAITVLLAVAVLGVALVIGNHIARPIVDLRARVREYGEGTLREKMPVKGSLEVRDLSKAFNMMMEQQKRAESALREHSGFLQVLINNIPNPIFYKDEKGKYLGCNVAFGKFLGMKTEDMVGKTVYDLAPRELADIYHKMDQALFDNPGVQVYESSVATGSGEVRNVIFNKATFNRTDGTLGGLVGTIVDITPQKKLEAQLLQAQKMEAIGTLTGGIAHDFNNIMMAIIGFGEFLQHETAADDPKRTYIDLIRSSAERAAKLTQSLLAFGRKQVINPEPVKLNGIVERFRMLIERLIGEDVALEVDLAHRDVTVMADTAQMEQVLMNLATNARDAMPGGGTLSISTGEALLDEDTVLSWGYGEPGRYGLLTVRDTGSGMDEEEKRRMFEPFFTTKESGKGTGLGLSIVYGIVKQHKGYINVSSQKGAGTVFSVYLPETRQPAEEKAAEDPPALRGSATLLLAEDDPGVRSMARLALERAGYTILEAVDGLDAVRVFDENSGRIDLLLFDFVMPNLNGREAYERIRSRAPGVKAILMSGYSDTFIHAEEAAREGFHVVSKPLSPQELQKKVSDVLGR